MNGKWKFVAQYFARGAAAGPPLRWRRVPLRRPRGAWPGKPGTGSAGSARSAAPAAAAGWRTSTAAGRPRSRTRSRRRRRCNARPGAAGRSARWPGRSRRGAGLAGIVCGARAAPVGAQGTGFVRVQALCHAAVLMCSETCARPAGRSPAGLLRGGDVMVRRRTHVPALCPRCATVRSRALRFLVKSAPAAAGGGLSGARCP